MVVVWSEVQTGLKKGFWHIVLRETRPGSEAARLLSTLGQEVKMHPVWEASCPCLSLCLFTDPFKLPGHPVIYSILPTGSSCPLLRARVDSDNFVIVPPPPKASALAISQCLGNSWPHKDSSKGHQTQAHCLLQTPHSGVLATPHNLPYPQLHNEPPTPCCFWDEGSFGNWYKRDKIKPKQVPHHILSQKRGNKSQAACFPSSLTCPQQSQTLARHQGDGWLN